MNRQQLSRLPWIVRRDDPAGATAVWVEGVTADRVDAIGSKTVQVFGEAVPQVRGVRVALSLEEVLNDWEVWNP